MVREGHCVCVLRIYACVCGVGLYYISFVYMCACMYVAGPVANENKLSLDFKEHGSVFFRIGCLG